VYIRAAHTLVILCSLAAGGHAQQIAVRPPIAGLAATSPTRATDPDDGVPVEMFESPNLDRFLHRAHDCLGHEDYINAVRILQQVIDGRTLEEADTSVGDKPERPDAEQPERPRPRPEVKPGAKQKPKEKPQLADPVNCVFSQDGRIYRPVRRLCHELLAGMPAPGLDIYRTEYEAMAQEALDLAIADGTTSRLEAVANRFFATLAAGKAMQILADRLMHEGRYRNAVQVLRDLGELYPAANLRQLGISPVWCQFKIALCLRLAGELTEARDAAAALAARYPDESLRIMGELQPLRTLADSPLFALGDESVVAEVGSRSRSDSAWVDAESPRVVPMWQYRFRRNPYQAPQKSNPDNNRAFMQMEGVSSFVAPPWRQYGTGTSMAFVGRERPAPRAVFLEGNRLRVADAFTGVQILEGDKDDEPPPLMDGRPSPRVPVYDFALQRMVEDERRYYTIAVYNRTSQQAEALKINELLAYDKVTGARLWSTTDFQEGDDGYKDVTFLAAPTVFGERLLAPVLHRGAYSLQCIDRATGRPVWRTRVHSGGSPYYKAPGSPVTVVGSTAFMLTNAGALAAIDAFAGDLRWIRRYERRDPLHDRATASSRPHSREDFQGAMQFVEQEMRTFLPSDLVTAGGLVILAPCDGHVLMALDGASGEPAWMLEGDSKYAPFGVIRYLVGANSHDLFAASESDLVCIGLQSGLIKWTLPLPSPTKDFSKWRGRGIVLEDQVLMPGDRELLVVDAENKDKAGWRHVPLPPFTVGDEPLRGPNNLFVSGPWLGVSYANGVEVYCTAGALHNLAVATDEPQRKATCLVLAGECDAALDIYARWLGGEIPDAALREHGTEQMIQLAREVALKAGSTGAAALDRARPFATSRQARMLWHLARLDFFKQVQDLRAYEEEQQRLYRFMEGKD
jgi:outer membrane protein assembly factor BamB